MQPDHDTGAPNEPPHDEIMAQLARILATAEFASSARLQRLLTFVVEETLAGRAVQLKEYTIATGVFDRDDSFDPQTSSIVRVEASRLRSKLEKYYAIGGADDPIMIELPTGSYIPRFKFRSAPAVASESVADARVAQPAAAPRQRQKITAVLILVCVVAIATYLTVDVWLLMRRTEQPVDVSKAEELLSIAVLPLRNFSGGPDQEYFTNGITDALITGLARERVAHVTSMTSVMAYKDVDRPMTEIAGELGVSHLVEGSILRIGDQVRITVQLIDARSDRHLWAQSYEREISDVLALQGEVVARIVASLLQYVEPQGAAIAATPGPVNPAAYEAHLKGRFFLNQMTEDGFRRGIEYFNQSIEIAPDYAPAHSGMAACYCLLGGHGFELVKPSEGMPTAKKAVMEALRLDQDRAEPHAFLGIIQLKYDWDWRSAEESFERAIAVNPSYSQAHIFYSFYLEAMGRQEAAVHEAETARALDPLSRATNVNLGWQYLQLGDTVKARAAFETAAEMYPGHWGVHWGIGQYHMRQGDYDYAIAAFELSHAAGGGHALPLSALGFAYAASGRTQEAKEVLGKIEALSDKVYVSPYHKATIYAGLNEPDAAFAALDEAYNVRSRSMAWLKVAPEMENLRSDPRYETLLARIGLTH